MANVIECTPIRCFELHRPFETITRNFVTESNIKAHASLAGNAVKPQTMFSKQPAGKSYTTGEHLIINQDDRHLAAYNHPHEEAVRHHTYVPFNTFQTTTSALSHMRR